MKFDPVIRFRRFKNENQNRHFYTLIILLWALGLNFIESAIAFGDELKDNSTILSYSGATQGNGYNMPATLGWLSQSLMKTYEEGVLIQARSGNLQRVYVDISSFGGSSSGSAVTLILDAILSNPSIIGPTQKAGSEGFLTLEGIKRIAQTVQFMAYGSSFGKLLKATTIIRYSNLKVKNFVEDLRDKLPYAGEIFDGHIPNLWKEDMNGQVVISDFGRLIFEAQNLDWTEINRPIQNVTGYSKWAAVRSEDPLIDKALDSVQTLSDSIQLEQDMLGGLSQTQHDNLSEFQAWQVAAIKKAVSTSVQKRVGYFSDLTRRMGEGMTPSLGAPEDQSNPFKKVLAQSMRNNFIISVIGVPFDSWETMQSKVRTQGQALDYRDFRAFVLVNETTARTLLQSSWYRREIQRGNSLLSKYIIAVVDQRWSGLNMSVREPTLLSELAGGIGSQGIRIEKMYDPQSDAFFQFKLISSLDPSIKQKVVFIVGGFSTQEINSVFVSLCLKERLGQLQKQGYHVESRFHLFGRDLQPGQKYFAVDSIARFFSGGNTERAAANIADWNAWSDSARSTLKNLMSDVGGALLETRAQWDLKGPLLPAMVSGLSPVVYARVANRTRQILSLWMGVLYPEAKDREGAQKVIFDPHPEIEIVLPLKDQTKSENEESQNGDKFRGENNRKLIVCGGIFNLHLDP